MSDYIEVKVPEFADMQPGDTIVSMTNNPNLPITVRRAVSQSLLPTAPYTVIRVTNTSGMESILIRNELGWYEIDDMSAPVEQPKTGWSFEVLSEPRAVAANHIVRYMQDNGFEQTAEDVAREFGVES